MSAILSNIYMLDFDTAITVRVNALGGFYRRYCDDMLCVIRPEHQAEIEGFVAGEIQKAKLKLQDEKTGRHHFRLTNGRLVCDQPLKYLGFSFDGQRVLLRNAAINRFYSKLRAGVNLAVQTLRRENKLRLAHGESLQPLKRRKLQILYTYIGRHNFPAYVYRAARKLRRSAIKPQIRNHHNKLSKEIANAIANKVPDDLLPMPPSA